MSPNVTNQHTPTEVEVAAKQKWAEYDAYLTYMAIGGVVTEDDGKITRITQQEFCAIYNVDRQTLLRWKKEPGFAMKVRERRDEIFPLARETAALNRLYIIGMTSKDHKAAVDALKTTLGHHANLRLPSQRVEHEVGSSFMDLVQAKRIERKAPVEAEIIDATPNPNSTPTTQQTNA